MASAIRRRTGSEEFGRRVAQDLLSISAFAFLELSFARSQHAQAIAVEQALRGMDAIVVQVASESGSVLVTLDHEIIQRAAGHVPILGVDAF
jgi:predicted nucleic acid-binding protein